MSSVEHPIFRGLMRKPIYRGDCLKSRPWTVWRFKRELGIKEGVLFLREVDTQLSESTAALYIAAVSAVVKVSRAAFFYRREFCLISKFLQSSKNIGKKYFLSSNKYRCFVVQQRQLNAGITIFSFFFSRNKQPSSPHVYILQQRYWLNKIFYNRNSLAFNAWQ